MSALYHVSYVTKCKRRAVSYREVFVEIRYKKEVAEGRIILCVLEYINTHIQLKPNISNRFSSHYSEF